MIKLEIAFFVNIKQTKSKIISVSNKNDFLKKKNKNQKLNFTSNTAWVLQDRLSTRAKTNELESVPQSSRRAGVVRRLSSEFCFSFLICFRFGFDFD